MMPSPEAGAWRLRGAASADGDFVLALLRAVSLPTEGVEDRFPGGYLVAEAGGRIIGTGGLERYGEYGLLRSLAVDPGWRGRGIGKALTSGLMERASAEGLKAVYLLTSTAEPYLARLGFGKVERKDAPAGIRASKEFTATCPASAVCMWRPLYVP